MLLRYLFGRQLLCRQCLSFVKPLTHQQRFQFLLSRKQFSTVPARARFFIPPENQEPPREPQELQDHQETPPRLENEENQTATATTDPTTTTESTSPDTAPGDEPAEPPLDLSHIPKNVKIRNDDIVPLNGEIRYVDANLVHHGIVKFEDVINSFDRSEYILLCVNPSVVSQNEPPTCLLTSMAHFLERERREAEAAALALLKRQKKPAITTRVLEFTWAISEHDLAHKMKKMGEFMQKGYRVEVIVGTRKGMPKVKAEQAKELIAKIRETGIMFGKEWKKEDGALGAQFTLFFEGKAPVKPEGEEGKTKEGKKKKKKRKFMTPEELEAEEREKKQ
ncbi:hypothetical protein B9Z19DRAFT_1122075 [Tuber borchii]|uniref:Translation initiation factor IF-3, C-terminal domain-domain-containing protein n=1 Tax=Tuber borchii TaxID=42251 RepID=A0A2T7A131_TUBBO|nr:hypothetical protein B9Z19DRAFT_1122075 [Tuber borchii]